MLGDAGRNAVEALFLEAGWIVNRIHSDYGEDVAVQPCTSKLVEKYRLCIQIKTVGARARPPTAGRSLPLAARQGAVPARLLLGSAGEARPYVWLNRAPQPEKYAGSGKDTVSFGLARMAPLDAKVLAYLAAQARNLFYEEAQAGGLTKGARWRKSPRPAP